MNYRYAMMLGRLSSGVQADHGKLVHAVIWKLTKRPPCPYNRWGNNPTRNWVETEVGICGARPGPKSVGWSTSAEGPLSCPKCKAKIEKYAAEAAEMNGVEDYPANDGGMV